MTGLDEYGPEQGAPPPKTGRPTDYTAELAEAICGLIAGTDAEKPLSLRAICRRDDMPDKTTVLRWLTRHEDFRTQYAQARELQADALFDECIEIADDTSEDWTAKETDSGVSIAVVDHEHIQRSKLRVDTRKWAAGKMSPKKYGDRVFNEHSGEIRTPGRDISDEELDARIAASSERLAALGLARGAAEGTGGAGEPDSGAGAPHQPQQAAEPLP